MAEELLKVTAAQREMTVAWHEFWRRCHGEEENWN